MAAQPEAGQDLVTVCTDTTDGGTLVRVVAPSRHIRMVDLMPVFEALDLNLVSYTAERDPDANGNGSAAGQPAPLARRKHSFRGRFLVTDADGHNLSEVLLDGLVAALQDALHVRLSRPARCAALNEESRRGSVASYATDASADPDSPSFAGAAASQFGQAHFGAAHGHGHGGHGFSHLNPGAQCYSSRDPTPQPTHLAQTAYSSQPYHPHYNHHGSHPYHHGHHEHTASAGSMVLSDHSMSSIGSLLRAPSGAASDHPTVPSPSMYLRLDLGPSSASQLQQQQSDTVFLDNTVQNLATLRGAGPSVRAGTTRLSVTGEPSVGDDRSLPLFIGAAPTTPFASAAAAAYDMQQNNRQHQHSYSQPASQPHTQLCDMYDLSNMPSQLRAASACSTPPNISGPLTLLPPNTTSAPQSGRIPDTVAVPGLPCQPVPSTSAPGILSPPSRPARVSFYDPAPTFNSGSTSAGATSATTPLHSPPPSVSASLSAAASSLHPAAAAAGIAGPCIGPMADAICGFGRVSAGNPEVSPGPSTAIGNGAGEGCLAAAGGAGAAGEDNSPSSSSDERDGSYTWWSTFSAQDTVARIMSHPARSISADADLGQAKSLMTKHNISALLVNTGSDSPGFITKRDFLKVQFSKNFKRTKVKDVMTQPVIFVDINLPIEQCSRVLEARGVRRVLVHDPSRACDADPLAAFVGVVSDADLFKCMGAPALSPVVGSSANSAEQCGQYHSGYSALPASAASLPPLPTLPSMPLLPATAPSQPLPATPSCPGLSCPSPHAHVQHPPHYPQQASHQAGLQHPQHGTSMQQQQQHQQLSQQQQQLQSQHQPPALSSIASTASATVSVSNSAGPSHATSMVGALSGVDAAAATAAAALALAGSAGSVVRLHAEASLADRYRCAAALWELDFTELEVTRRIGEGSFGEVLLANFRGTKVAVKRLRGFDVGPDNPDTGAPGETGPSPTQMPIFRQFFEREIEILATIRHPNVVNFIGACHTPPNVCLVTEYCARGSLDHLLHKSSIPLDLLKKVEFSMDIARGMSCLHSQKPPIIHRDLKTANLLVSARFEVKVADFGLSRIKDHAQLINSRAGLEGTVEYAAPEVLRGEPYTEKCDIWSYSILLWEIIHRQRPYADADVPIYILMMSLGNGTLRLPPVREDAATPGLARLVERCMAWHPTERPSFREVLHALEAEYKILRGKAAAVPRSDSASSMMVLPGGQNRPGAGSSDAGPAAAAASVQPHGGPTTSTAVSQEQHSPFVHGGAGAAAGRAHPHPHPQPQPQPNTQPHPHQAALALRKSSKLGLNPHGQPNTSGMGGADASGAAGGGGGWRGVDGGPFAADATLNGAFWDQADQPQPPPAVAAPSRPRVKLALPPQHQGGGAAAGHSETPDPVSPADSSSRPSSSRTAATGRSGAGAGGGGGGKPSSAGRPTGRSLRSAARSKSMPLPEFEWFAAEEGLEEYMDTTDSMADEDAEAGASTATSTSGIAAVGAAAAAAGAHPLDRGGVHSTPYPDASSFRPVDADDVAAAAEPESPDAAAAGSAEGLPHHLVVRVRRDDVDGIVAGPAMTTPSAAAGRPHVVSAFAAAAMAVEEEDEEDEAARDARAAAHRAWLGASQPAQPAVDAAAVAAGGVVRQLHVNTASAAAAASAALGGVTFTPASALASRPSPFHMASNSPFANAADLPWSPKDTEDAPETLSSRFSMRQSLHQVQQRFAAVTTEEDAAMAAPAVPPQQAPPMRVTFVSPFAQLAAEAPALRSRDPDEDEDDEEEGGGEEADEEEEGRADDGRDRVSGGGHGPARPGLALATTANSTDVNTAAEKDQRLAVPESCWAVLGTCSKPPSGDVYSNGGAAAVAAAGSRLSPVRPASPPTLAAVYAAAHQISPVDMRLSGGDIDEDSAVAAILRAGTAAVVDVQMDAGAAAAAAAAAATVQQASDVDQQLLCQQQQPPLIAGVAMGFVGPDSDQFDDEEDDDAALHTTAWVRL